MNVDRPSLNGASKPRGRALIVQIAAPLRHYLGTEAGSGRLLLAATLVALVWANSSASGSYSAFWGTEVSLRVGGAGLALDLRHWVNDGLMVFFFFVVGLEVKRELAMGGLTDRRRAAVPVVAAAAGLLVPALVYLAIDHAGAGAAAWGVVVSTDTAFVLGVLALVGPGATQLRLFLLTLAIADDIGALTVIALFYTERIAFGPLALAAIGFGLMAALRHLRVWRGPAYLVIAVGMWVAMERSGIHPTIAGVAIALSSPTYPARREEVEDAARLTRAYRQSPNPEFARAARLSIERSVSVNERLQQLYHPWTSYVIVPIFALANAGVALDPTILRSASTSPITLGVIAGLVFGKPLGILLGVVVAVRTRLGRLVPGLGAVPVAGGAVLSGMGFTISLLIVDLALRDPVLADQARIGVLAATLLAGVVGWLVLRVGIWSGRGDGTAGQPTVLVPLVEPDRDHIRGPVDAPLTLVEYSDFECPFCGRATGVVEELHERLGDRFRYVFRHVPLVDVHPHAELAAEAAEAAGAQGRFWEMHDRLFAHRDRLQAVDLLDHAAAVGLDLPRFTRDLGTGRYADRVRDDAASAEASGVTGTPTFFVGGQRHTGPYDADTLVTRLLAAEGDGAAPASPTNTQRSAATPLIGPLRPGGHGPVLASVALPDELVESPDRDGAYPRLTAAQIAALDEHGDRRACTPGDTLFREGDPAYAFFVVVTGLVAVLEDVGRATQQVVAVHGPGRFVGELGVLTDQVVTLTAVVVQRTEVIRLDATGLRRVFDADHALEELVVRALLLRRSRLLELGAETRIVDGPELDAGSSAGCSRGSDR